VTGNLANPLTGWHIDRDSIGFVGQDLQRPECILAEPDGTIWTADARSGVMRIDPDGSQTLVTQTRLAVDATETDRYLLAGSLPNGITFASNGDLIIANFGTDTVERMTRDGHSTTLCTELDGRPLGKVNFAMTDRRGRIWITVTTRISPWIRSINERTADGYVAVMDDDGALRLVADHFIGTNEIRFDAAEEWLYVVESNAHRISRIRLGESDEVLEREVYGPTELPGTPDGMAFDQAGNLWITLIHADRLVAITPEGELLTLLDDGDPDQVADYAEHVRSGTVTPELMGRTHGTLAPLMASLTFGGPDLCTVYLGSILGNRLPTFRSPVPGLPLAHWR
jgi:gluconolactonase